MLEPGYVPAAFLVVIANKYAGNTILFFKFLLDFVPSLESVASVRLTDFNVNLN